MSATLTTYGSRLLLGIAAAAFAAGCTLGPEPGRPATAADAAGSFAHAAVTTADEPASVSPWWRSFGDEATTELVELALANNTDLQVAAARVLEVEANLRRAGGARWPQLSYGAGATKQRISFVLPEVGRRTIDSTTYSTTLGASWQADLFGRLKRTRQSQWALLLAEEANREAVVHAVVAAVVRARVLAATAGRQRPEPWSDATGQASPARSSSTWHGRTWPRRRPPRS
jgi:multidrug efflux system outer membrane protein